MDVEEEAEEDDFDVEFEETEEFAMELDEE